MTNTNLFEGVTAIEGMVPKLLQAIPPEAVGAPSCPVLAFTVEKKRPSSVSENSQRYSPAVGPPDPLDEPPQPATPNSVKEIMGNVTKNDHTFVFTQSPRTKKITS